MKRAIPAFRTDEEAEKFVDTADLSTFDLSGFLPVRFEFKAKDTQLNMRVPESLLDAVKAKAKASGMPYTRYIRMVLERAVG
jgi:predicted DNA binding CopG/RHH family protein